MAASLAWIGSADVTTWAGWSWARSNGLWALVLPLLVLLASLRRERPDAQPVGTFALWSRVGPPPSGVFRRRRVPPARVLLILALVAGALALAGPERVPAASPRSWRVIVDRSPSMYLEHEPPGVETRLDVALAAFEGWLAAQGERGELAWGTGDESGDLRAAGFPPAWRGPPEIEATAPRWEWLDASGVVWLTDRVVVKPRRAGVFASGGAAVPGPVASLGTTRLDWDGRDLVPVDGALEPRAIVIDEALPPRIAAIARIWAEDRELRIVGPGAGETADVEVLARASGERQLRAGRDGWRFSARAGSAPRIDERGARLEAWLEAPTAEGAVPLVTFRRGRIACSITDMDEPEGDPAAFAVSWATLLDSARRAAPGVVALAERTAAGESVAEPPVPGAARSGGSEVSSVPLDAVLAAAGALLAFVALFVPGAIGR